MSTKKSQMRESLKIIRCTLKMTQVQMATQIGMSLRAYSDIETGMSECRLIHVLAAERVALEFAANAKNPNILTTSLKKDIEIIARLPLWA